MNTEIDIDMLEAGPELDELIAGRIFGGPETNVQWYWWNNSTPSLDIDPPLYAGPAFSTDRAAACEVLDWAASHEWAVNIHRGHNLHGEYIKQWIVTIGHPDERLLGKHENLSVATCRAALKTAEKAAALGIPLRP